MADQSLVQRTQNTQGARTVTALMGITVAFALLGSEIKNAQTNKANPGPKTGDAITAGGKIILGGLFGTTVLILISHAGDGGREFAVGLALISMVTATLVYGGPVWKAIGNTYGSTPTSPTGATSATKATSPTSSTGATTATAGTN